MVAMRLVRIVRVVHTVSMLGAVVWFAGCAHQTRSADQGGATPSAAAGRPDRDTVPDRIAAQREAAGFHQNDEDQRFGTGPARELKERERQKNAAQAAGASSKATNVTGAPPPSPPPAPAATP